MNKYLSQIQRGMDLLGSDSRTLFIGQAMRYKGHAVSQQVMHFPLEKRIELPVAEDFQSGFALGLALQGYIPVSIYPRHDFTILALNQIINHIDKWTLMCPNSYPKIIIKILVGAKKPLNGGYQHTADYIEAFKKMCQTIKIVNLTSPDEIYPAYKTALNDEGSYILSEYTELY
ncbi:MAG: Transketolase central region-containing protein [Candidatus Roizmanbacteria bacterium GW2011_GWA2_37_7]|uniref:Transketolase central region-containing protein n=1 Tax=Candidatus Roizmanbacteria bacterium GW2011_GWA2_37_7 TaxID=1618481 RepID=A0A0G0KDD8_9BACT|nr:MAG: Transketolase central region-containing protein [Candidatus Roizmanbacteria bacterium GW2011_GWA2_37_7]